MEERKEELEMPRMESTLAMVRDSIRGWEFVKKRSLTRLSSVQSKSRKGRKERRVEKEVRHSKGTAVVNGE